MFKIFFTMTLSIFLIEAPSANAQSADLPVDQLLEWYAPWGRIEANTIGQVQSISRIWVDSSNRPLTGKYGQGVERTEQHSTVVTSEEDARKEIESLAADLRINHSTITRLASDLDKMKPDQVGFEAKLNVLNSMVESNTENAQHLQLLTMAQELSEMKKLLKSVRSQVGAFHQTCSNSSDVLVKSFATREIARAVQIMDAKLSDKSGTKAVSTRDN